MKTKAIAVFNYLSDFLRENPKQFHTIVLITVFLPLFLSFYILDCNFQILVFLAFGYITSFVGYHISSEITFGENSIQNFRKHYRLIAENLNDIVIIHRLKDGKNEYINTAAKTILGYLPKDLIGQQTIFIVHPEDQKKVKNQLSNVALLNDYFFVETVRVRSNNGDFKWMELNVKTLKNEFGQQSFAIFTLRDISETIELEKATKLFAEELFYKYTNYGQVEHKKLYSTLQSNT